MSINTQNDIPRIGIVGCGAITEKYYLPAIARISGAKDNLILSDVNKDRLQAMVIKFNVPHCIQDYREMYDKVDGVILAVPPKFHYSMSMDFLAHGVHVLCEKPLANTAAEAIRMVARATESNVTLSVNHVRRLYPAYKRIVELIRNGTLGKLQYLSYLDGLPFGWPTASGFYFNDPGKRGVLFDRGVHVLDTICWWLGKKPKLISSENDSQGGPEGTVSIECDSEGCKINIMVSWLTKLQNTYKIIGELGTIEGNIGEWQSFLLVRKGKSEKVSLDCKERDYYDFADKMIVNFFNIIKDNAKPLIPAIEIIPTIELVDECYQKATRSFMPWYEASDYVSSSISENNKKNCSHVTNEQNKKTILITGAGGFIGGWIVEDFLLRDEFNVQAAIRSWSSAARISRFPVNIIFCDILDQQQIDKALDNGVDIVVHCAVGSEDVTIKGTQILLKSALQMGVQRFIYISSAVVYGNIKGNVDEDTKLIGKSEYAIAKIEAENLCWEFYQKGLPVTIFRPSIVYGPFGKVWTMAYAERLLSGNWGIYEGYGEGICNLIYIKDLVYAVRLSINNDRAIGQAFNINGPENLTWNQYFSAFNNKLGRPELKVIKRNKTKLNASIQEPIRQMHSFLMSHFGEFIMNIYMSSGPVKNSIKGLKTTLSTTPSLRELNELFNQEAIYVNAKAQTILGFRPQFNMEAGLNQSVLWLNQNGIGRPKNL